MGIGVTFAALYLGVFHFYGTIAGISLIANVILSILLSRSCRRVSVDYDTTPIYRNENVSNTDQTEMYTGLDFKEDRCAYQALTRGKEVIYSNTNI
uniref:Uncharacterized protein n=1 Tax=Magallana gigas TaxID=29159 RepID=A0A8W8JCZ7_MAGGI